MKVDVKNISETKEFGKKIAEKIRLGDLLLLSGDLGAGKTTLVQAIAERLGVKSNITSSSFSLVQEYPAKNGIFRHIDLYRLDDPTMDVNTIGLPEMLADDSAITAVEWPERLKERYRRKGRTIRIIIKYGEKEGEREIETDINC